MLNLRLVSDNIRPQTLCGSFIEPSTVLNLLLVILPSYKHVEYLLINETFLYLMNIQTHNIICNYETDKGIATIQVPVTLFNISKGKHLGTTFPSLQFNICGITT